MLRYLFLVVMLGTVGMLLGVPYGRSDEKVDASSVKPLITLYGRNSRIKERKLVRITTAEDWRALWREHKAGSTKPMDVPGDMEYAELDFENIMAIAVFEGSGINCRGYSSHSINEVEGRLLVRVRAHSYQSGEDTPATQAWGILILPRSAKEVVLEHDVRYLIDEPPKWKEWARFPALEAKNR
jgi:hypothetical protein